MWEMSSVEPDVFLLCVFIRGVTARGFSCSLYSAILPPPKFWDWVLVSTKLPRFLGSYSEGTFQSQTWKVQSLWHVIQEQQFMSVTSGHCKWWVEGCCFIMTAVTGQTSPRSVTEPLPGRGHSQTDKQQCLRSDFWKQSLSHSAWTPSLISQCYFEVSYSTNVDVNVWWFGIGVRFLRHCDYQISNICTILKSKCWPFHYLFYFSVICIIIIFLYRCLSSVSARTS